MSPPLPPGNLPLEAGHAGRVLTRACTVEPVLGPVTLASGHGPLPGTFHGEPLTVALLLLAGLVALALRAIVNRPRPDLDSRGLDTMLRRWSVGNVLTAATVTVLGTLGPVALLMLSAVSDDSCAGGMADTFVIWAAAIVGPLATGAAFGLIAGLVVTPTIRVDDLPRPLPGDAAPVGAPVR